MMPNHTGNAQQPRTSFLVLCAISFFSILLALLFNAPRVYTWHLALIDLPTGHRLTYLPEISRLLEVFQVIEHPSPFSDLELGHPVIKWRLLFPALIHFLGLPPITIALSGFLGVLGLSLYCARYCYHTLGNYTQTFFCCTLINTAAWFFVATGWLSYNDGWYLLSLVAASQAKNWKIPFWAGLVTPWIDERYLVGLPLVFIVQWHQQSPQAKLFSKEVWLKHIAPHCTILCYLLLRLYAISIQTSSVESDYFKNALEMIAQTGASAYAEGIWMTFRLGWILIPLGIWALHKQRPQGILWLSSALFFEFAFNLLMAADINRSLSIFLPVALCGIAELSKLKTIPTKRLTQILAVGTLFNLVLPVKHVIGQYQIEVEHSVTEYYNYKKPHPDLRANHYVKLAIRDFQAGKPQHAFIHITTAIALDPRSAEPYIAQARFLQIQGQPQAALVILRSALPQVDDPESIQQVLQEISAQAHGK